MAGQPMVDAFVARNENVNTQQNDALAAAEHRQFMAEETLAHPAAAPVYAGLTVGYQLAKFLHVPGLQTTDQPTTPASMNQLEQGLAGIGDGLKAFMGMKNLNPKNVAEGKIQIARPMDAILPSLIATESSGQHTDASGNLITSGAGAKGLTQVMPKTGVSPGYGVKPLQDSSPEEYKRFASDYLNAMYRVFQNKEQAVAAYNAGPGAIHRAISKEARTGKDWKTFIPKETRNYITKVAVNENTTI
jgi:hypothetical protein